MNSVIDKYNYNYIVSIIIISLNYYGDMMIL